MTKSEAIKVLLEAEALLEKVLEEFDSDDIENEHFRSVFEDKLGASSDRVGEAIEFL